MEPAPSSVPPSSADPPSPRPLSGEENDVAKTLTLPVPTEEKTDTESENERTTRLHAAEKTLRTPPGIVKQIPQP